MRNMRSRKNDDLVRTWRKGSWVEPGGAVGDSAARLRLGFSGGVLLRGFMCSQGDDDVVGFLVDK